jgi:large subunit ribosomal protein L18
MDAQKLKVRRAERRKFRVRKAIRGTAQRPRLSVHRTNFHIYAQLIDDDAQLTLAAASSNDKDAPVEYGGNVAAAAAVGRKLAEKATAKGITHATFDRGSLRFHGRVKALARAATEGGLVCTGLTDAPKKEKAAPAAAKPAKAEKAGKGEGKKKEAAKA